MRRRILLQSRVNLFQNSEFVFFINLSILSSSSLRAKYRSADGVSVPGAADKSKKRKKFDASRKCAMADGFVQCLYDGIGKRVGCGMLHILNPHN